MATARALISELVDEYSTSHQFIQSLLEGGIEFDDIQDVLDMRRDRFIGSVEQAESLSAKDMVALYQMVEGDLEMMAIALDQAIAITHRHLSAAVRKVVAQGPSSLLYGASPTSGVPWWSYPEGEELDELGIFNS